MPTYLPKIVKPDFIDNPSVFDPAYKRAIRGIVKGLGLDDPASSLPTPNMLGSVVAGKGLAKALASKVPMPKLAEPEAQFAKSTFDDAINAALEASGTRSQRAWGKKIVNNAYEHLANNELAADPAELARLKEALKKYNIPKTGLEAPAPLTPEQAAGLSGLQQSRTYGVPSVRTRIEMSPNSQKTFAPMTRIIPREPGLNQQYIDYIKLKGIKPSNERTITINRDPNSRPRMPAPIAREVSKTDMTIPENVKPIIEQAGSVQAALPKGQKAYTARDIKAMLNGPRQAYASGAITKNEMNKILAENQAKIDRYNQILQQKDQSIYDQKLQDALLRRKK